MTNRIVFILALSFSFIFGVDPPKEVETSSQTTTEIQFDAEVFQQNLQIKKGMIQNYKQARKAKRIPKPAGSPIYISNQKSGKALKKETPAKKVLENEVQLEKRENAKQKLNELRAISEEYRQKKEMSERDKKAFSPMGHSQQPKTNRLNFKQKLNELRAQSKAGNTTVTHDAMRKIKLDHQTSTRSRSRSIGTEFEFETIANLYEAFGDVLATEGSGCDGCPGNLDEMEVEASFPIFRQDSFEAWASDSLFTAFYFQFIDENETGEYDDGEIYAVSCEDSEISNNKTVAYNGSVYDLDFVDFWMEAYDFDWDNDNDNDEPVFFEKEDYADVSDPANWDQITESVAITRADNQGLFNPYSESSYNELGEYGPAGTLWAPMSTEEATMLDTNVYTSWHAAMNNNPQSFIDETVSLWCLEEDKYYDIVMASWTNGNNGGGFSYWRYPADGHDEESGWLIAHVFDWYGNPIQEAHVSVWNDEFDINSMTNENGLTVVELLEGYYEVDAWAEGFESEYYGEVEILSNEETVIEFYLEPDSGGGFDWTFLGEFDGHEYWLSGFESTWNDASMLYDYFEEIHLVTISSQEENDFVFEHTGGGVWIGFTDQYEEGNWQWITGEEVTYTNWNEGEPNNANGVEHWAQMFNNGNWNDLPETMLPFVVEVDDDSTGGGDYFIEGIVRDFDGNPIADVDVWAESMDFGGNAMTNEGGYYHIELDSEALYRVEIWADEYWQDLTMVEVWEGGTQHDFMLGHQEETALLEIQTMSEFDFVPFAELESPQSPQGMSVSDWDGWDFITIEAPTDFAEVFGWHPEFGNGYGSTEDWNTEINPGDEYFVDVIFGDDSTGGDYGAIYGSVQDMYGSRIPYAEVYAWNYDYFYAVTTDENGDFFMEVPAGYYDMEAWAPGYSSEMNWVEVYPNEYSWVEFWLYPEDDYNTLVHGHVHDVDGNPLSFANVNANYLYDEWESEGTFTNEDGYYELYLRDDAYRITAGAEGFWVSAYDSIYVGGDSLWLDFMLSPVGEFNGGWQGNINLVGDHQPQLIYLAIMSEDYQVFRILYEPGPQEVELVNGNYHILAGADGYREVFIMNAINIENNWVNFDIHLVQEGLLLPPQIEFAGDVPNDQGRQMRLVWNPGVPGDWGYFEFFSIWRQVNEAPMVLWDFVTTVPWHGMESYSAVVPTLGDSTDMGIYWSTFRVTGHTENPNEFYDSAPVTGYSIDNLHPGAPGGVQAFTGGEGILLTWDSSMDEDFGYHRIYRYDTDSGEPAIQFTTVDTFYVDDAAEGNYEYWITAVDLNGNESDPSIIVTVTLAIDNGLAVPIEFALQQNYPNPFNPSTQIQYALPTDANVTIAIYDLVGRQIRTLVNEQVTAGFHSTLWNATNDMGSPVSAGVYIYTITANDFRDVKKMILLK